jgi:hypothetical protein
MLKIFGRDLVVASYVRLFEFWKKKERKSFFLSFLQNFLFSIFSEVSLGHVDAQSYNSKRQREEKKEFLLLEKKSFSDI